MACLIKLILAFSLAGFCQAKIDEDLKATLSSGGISNVLIDFHGSNTEALQSVGAMTFSSRVEKIEALRTALQAQRDRSQGAILEFLGLEGLSPQVRSFWSSNQMVVRDANLKLIQALGSFSQVSRIQKEPVIQLSPMEMRWDKETTDNATGVKAGVEWGVNKIGAEDVWALGIQGEGVIVGNIDTGVLGTHEALRDNYLNNGNSWFDPLEGSESPEDPQGHGTHVMGTIVGINGIGVAPQAKWIACRGINADGNALMGDLIACGQWMAKPGVVPHIIANSWGGLPGADNNLYNPTIQLWREVGILFDFAIGNDGATDGNKKCENTGSPGNQEGVFSVGATDKDDKLAVFSSRGPQSGRMKPEISAPGVNIRSAWSDGKYNTIDGTSMACPHVAGVMALMQSAEFNKGGGRLLQDSVVTIIEQQAFTGVSLPYNNGPCPTEGDGQDDPSRLPNNGFGFGRIDALAAVNVVIAG